MASSTRDKVGFICWWFPCSQSLIRSSEVQFCLTQVCFTASWRALVHNSSQCNSLLSLPSVLSEISCIYGWKAHMTQNIVNVKTSTFILCLMCRNHAQILFSIVERFFKQYSLPIIMGTYNLVGLVGILCWIEDLALRKIKHSYAYCTSALQGAVHKANTECSELQSGSCLIIKLLTPGWHTQKPSVSNVNSLIAQMKDNGSMLVMRG